MKKRLVFPKSCLVKTISRKFFQSILGELSEQTGAQMAAVYLLNEKTNQYEHFESIGTNENAKQSFAADSFEGEFGAAILSKKIQHIENIPENTRFAFRTINHTFIPNEIITIPVITNSHVIAIRIVSYGEPVRTTGDRTDH